jgi:hypothetical protein
VVKNPGQIGFGMTDAAFHFGVPVPIARRDRKGAPKPRQWDESME